MEAALGPTRRGSPYEALAQLGSWLGLALPGRGGFTNPAQSPEVAALIGKFAQRFPKVWNAINRKVGDVPVQYPVQSPLDPAALGTAVRNPLNVTVRGGGAPTSYPSNTLLHEALHFLYGKRGGYPPVPYQKVIAKEVGPRLSKRAQEALDAEEVEQMLLRLAGVGEGKFTRSPWGEAAIEKMSQNVSRRSLPLRFP